MDLPRLTPADADFHCLDRGRLWFILLSDGMTSICTMCRPFNFKSRKKPLAEFFVEVPAQ